MNKKIAILIVVLLVITASIIKVAYAAEEADINTYLITSRENGKYVTDPTSNVIIEKSMPSEYGFGLGQQPESYETYNQKVPTAEQYTNSQVQNVSIENIAYTTLSEDIKGKFSILYKNAGKYNGNNIDVKATLMDYSVCEHDTLYPLFGFWKTYIDSDLRWLNWAKIKYEFFISGTNTPISIKGNTTYYDIDGSQGIHILDNNKGIYATNESKIQITSVNGTPYVYDNDQQGYSGSDIYNPKGAVTEIFEGESITRVFTVTGKNELNQIGCSAGGMRLNSASVIPSKNYDSSSEAGINSSPVKVNDEIKYLINYVNGHPTESVKLTITDTLSVGLEYVSNSSNIGEPTITKNNDGSTKLIWVINNLPPSTSNSLIYKAKVTEEALSIVENKATVQYNDDTIYNLEPLKNPVPSKKYASDTPSGKDGTLVKTGDKIKYEISYANSYKEKTNIIITDTLSKGLEYVKKSSTIKEPTITKNENGTTTLKWTIEAEKYENKSLIYEVNVTGESITVENSAKIKIGNTTEISLEKLKNPLGYGNITILKEDEEKAIPIEGVEFSLYKNNGKEELAKDIYGNNVKNVITNTNGIAEFENIPYGFYILKEVKTNGWYKPLKEPLKIVLDEKNDALKYEEQNNDKIIPLEKYKLGDPTNNGIVDEKDIEIIDKIINNQIEETSLEFYASDVNKDLAVTEIDKNLINDYINGNNQTIELLKEEIIPGQIQKRVSIVVTNQLIDMKINKLRLTEKTYLEGVKITIKNSQNEIFLEYTTDDQTKEFSIPIGDYTLIETKAPNGYQKLEEEIKFRVLPTGNILLQNEDNKLYELKNTKETNDTDLDQLDIYNEAEKISVPNTGSTIKFIVIVFGIMLISSSTYVLIKRYNN